MRVGELAGVFGERVRLYLVGQAALQEAVLLRQRAVTGDDLVDKGTDGAFELAVVLLVSGRFLLRLSVPALEEVREHHQVQLVVAALRNLLPYPLEDMAVRGKQL